MAADVLVSRESNFLQDELASGKTDRIAEKPLVPAALSVPRGLRLKKEHS